MFKYRSKNCIKVLKLLEYAEVHELKLEKNV